MTASNAFLRDDFAGGHPAEDYPGADQVEIRHPELSPGDACPDCYQGTLYEKPPGVLVRFVGQPTGRPS